MFLAGMKCEGAAPNEDEKCTLLGFCKSADSPILKIEVPANCRSCQQLQSDLCWYPQEKEFLLRPYAPIRFIREQWISNFLGDGKARGQR